MGQFLEAYKYKFKREGMRRVSGTEYYSEGFRLIRHAIG